MNAKQIEDMLAEVKKCSSKLDKVSAVYGKWVMDNPEKAMAFWIDVIEKQQLLKPTGMIRVPATTEIFFAHTNFVVDAGGKPLNKLGYLGPTFRDEFCDKTENSMKGGRLYSFSMRNFSKLHSVIEALGGEKKVETSLVGVHSFMSNIFDGKKSAWRVFENNSGIFFVRNKFDVLRAVDFYWHSYYGWWGIEAYLIESLSEYRVGAIFSPYNPF